MYGSHHDQRGPGVAQDAEEAPRRITDPSQRQRSPGASGNQNPMKTQGMTITVLHFLYS